MTDDRDIVLRLREPKFPYEVLMGEAALMAEAADEIERLRKDNDRWIAEIVRLRAEMIRFHEQLHEQR